MKITLGEPMRQRDGEWVMPIKSRADLGAVYDEYHDKVLEFTPKVYREKRSLSANAYFHVLVNKIASIIGATDDEVKKRLAVDYGTVATRDDGAPAGLKLPKGMNVDDIYPYTKWFDSRVEGGVQFDCYIVYKRTHTMDTKEMSRLIDGTIHEAKDLGIETMPQKELEAMLSAWSLR